MAAKQTTAISETRRSVETPGAVVPSAAWWGAAGFATALGFSRVSLGLFLPAIKAEIPSTFFLYGLTASGNFIGYLAGTLATPFLLRLRINRLTLLSLSLLVTGITLLAGAGIHDLVTLSVLRFINGFTQGPATVLIISLVLERVPAVQRGRASGLIWAGISIGFALTGVATMSVLATHPLLSWRAAWVLMGLAVVAVIPGLRASLRGAQLTPPPAAATDGEFSRAKLARLAIVYGLFGFSFIVFFTYFTAYEHSIGVGAAAIGFIWLLAGIAGAIGAIFWSWLMARPLKANILPFTFVLGAIGMLGIPTHQPVFTALGALIAVFASLGIPTQVTLLVRRHAPGHLYALAFSIITIAFAIGQTIGAPVGGAVADHYGLAWSLFTCAGAFLVGSAFATGTR